MADKTTKRKNRKTVQVSKLYENGKSKRKTCPKCGAGVILGQHKDRNACGKCGYTEFTKKA